MNVFVSLKINDYVVESNGKLTGNLLMFYDGKNKLIFDVKSLSLKRYTDEHKIVLDFGIDKGYIDMGDKKRLDLDMKSNIISLNPDIIIDYEVNGNMFKLDLKYKEL